jgi:hypothetical protein
MKKNNIRNKNRESHSRRIHLEFRSPTAKAASIAGTSNDWQPERDAYDRNGSSRATQRSVAQDSVSHYWRALAKAG